MKPSPSTVLLVVALANVGLAFVSAAHESPVASVVHALIAGAFGAFYVVAFGVDEVTTEED